METARETDKLNPIKKDGDVTSDIERVSFSEYNDAGKMTRYEGVVEDRFVDPEERYDRPSLAVRMDDGTCQTPYEDECRPVKSDADKQQAQIAQNLAAQAAQRNR